MKKIFIVLILLLFLDSCFLNKDEKNIISNISSGTITNLVGCNDIIKKEVNIKNSTILKLRNNYYEIKENYSSGSMLKKLAKELNITEGFAIKKCDIIKEKYGRDLCFIYVSGDYSKLDNFPFEGGEKKSEYILMYDSLKQGKILPGAKEKNITPILNWYKLGKKIKFKFNDDKDTFRVDYYVYLKQNGKEKFFNELDKQFLDVCKKNNNEN